ncbi:MAG: GntR family transcriptional regulator [Betaproteobacteria bacterium]|nr:GntR family transcriptional regulator [Betaproteobacteria bacterium]
MQNDAAIRPKRPRNLAHQLVEGMSERIKSGALKVGDKLPTESELVATYGVSRTVVREAISHLQAAGLVETQHGIGTFVLEQSGGANFRIDASEMSTVMDVLAVLELRISLETEAAGLAAQRRSEGQLEQLRRALAALIENVAQAGDAASPDYQFHLQIALATGNPHFAGLMSYLGTMVIPRNRVNTARLAQEDRVEYLRRVNREHQDIFDAIERRDSDAARAAMRTHLGNSRERLKRAHVAAEAGS